LSCFEDFDESDWTSSSLPVNALIPFLGAGKVILQSPKNVGFHSFNQDYYCHFISKKTTSGRQISSFVKYDFGSIAEYFFLYNTTDVPIFDVVFCQPPKKCKLASLDSVDDMANIALNDARLYYYLRCTNFMKKGSILVIFIAKKDVDSFVENVENYQYRTAIRLDLADVITDSSDDNDFVAIKYKAV
jgi:hypothetical protein